MIYAEAKKGTTIFVTTHYMDEAEYCDRVSIMVEGRIEALDTPKNLKAKYNVTSMNDVFLKMARNVEQKWEVRRQKRIKDLVTFCLRGKK
jgi:ABC-2 type transport system ATP-binding protein